MYGSDTFFSTAGTSTPAQLSPFPGDLCLLGGVPMICPVPIRTGYAMQLGDIYCQWKMFPCDYEGSVYASFTCPYTGQNTSMASMEQVGLVIGIATNLSIDTTTPLVFQYQMNNEWVNFSFIDQLGIASRCCKLYRAGISDGYEPVLVCQERYALCIVINKRLVDFQMQPVHDSERLLLARMTKSPPNFFATWTFVNHASDFDPA
jgi:hypothetical protein